MKREFDVYGGFRLKKGEEKRDFWERVIEICRKTIKNELKLENALNLKYACGCYVFAIRHGENLTPWYVGKAERSNFNTECFSLRNKQIHDRLHNKNGSLRMFFLPALTEGGKLRRIPIRGDNYIEKLEDMLVSMALGANGKLFNIQGAAMLRNMVVPGVIGTGPGQPPQEVQDLKNVLGLS